MTITGIDRVRIAAHIGRSLRTVERVYRGEGNEYSRDAVTRAARELGYPPPPPKHSNNSPSGSPPPSHAA